MLNIKHLSLDASKVSVRTYKQIEYSQYNHFAILTNYIVFICNLLN